MIPVMASTKTDKSAIDLAGVEAGAKIFVPWEGELVGSLAHTVRADQRSRIIVCTRNPTVEDFIFNIEISLLSSFTSEPHGVTDLAPSPKILTAWNSVE
jgi:hypothetical protein